MSVRKKATPKKGRAQAKAAPTRRKAASKPSAKKKPASKPKPAAKKKAVAKKPAPKKAKPKAKVNARKDAEREKALRAKDKEREKKEREKDKAREKAEREKAAKAKDKARKDAEREKEKARKDAEREKAAKAKEKEREKKELEKEKARVLKAKEAERLAALKAKEAEKERIRLEKEAEKEAIRKAKDAEREEAKRLKDEERKAKEAEREAYRKAKEAERERIRADKEATRRALEGKVARANKRAQRGDGISRGVTTRQYRADTIPNQAGTTRRHDEPIKLIGVRVTDIAQDPPRNTAMPVPVPAPPPPPPTPPALPIEDRWAQINERLSTLDDQFQREYRESFEMSWVYHDSALEGVVYTFQELKTAIDPNMSVVADSGLQPVCDEIRRHRQAIEYVRELSEKKRVPITVDTIKKIYCILHPEEGDVKTVKYRKDIPQHRLYFHEYAAPDKIAYKARQVIDWLNGPEPKKLKSPIRIAARIHYDLLRVFPFPQDSGKVSRLLMNVLLMRAGHPPAIIHSTERQRYYEALKGALPVIVAMVSESINNALLSIEKKIEDHDATKLRSSAPPSKGEEKPQSAVVAATSARDNDLDSDYLDSELEDSDGGDSDGDSEGESED